MNLQESYNYKDAALRILVVVLLTIIGAYISFEIDLLDQHIPITGQSLAVMVGCFFLRPKEAIIAMVLYLTLGMVGLPVFAGGSSGWEKVFGATGGFLYGFIISGWIISVIANKLQKVSYLNSFIAMVIATIVLLAFGNFHLSLKIGFEKALANALYPFWKAAVIKAALGAGIIIAVDFFRNLKPVN